MIYQASTDEKWHCLGLRSILLSRTTPCIEIDHAIDAWSRVRGISYRMDEYDAGNPGWEF